MSEFTALEIGEWINAFRYDGTGRGMAACQAFRELATARAEITRLRAELERVRGQRDEALLDLDSALNGRVLVSRVSEYIEREHRVRIIGEGKTRTVEEIEG